MRRRGLTLIELLIVCFIIVLFVAIAIPLARPNTEETRLREGARQLNAYFAEAKAYAAQRGRPVSLVFDRGAAANEGARDANIVTRLYIADSPPHYSGDDLSSNCAVHNGQSPPIAGLPIPRGPIMGSTFDVTMIPAPPFYSSLPPASGNVPPAFPVGSLLEQYPPEMSGQKAQWYALQFNGCAMLPTILQSYLQAGGSALQFIPFRIRFGGRGSYFDAYAECNGPSLRCFCWAPFGKNPPPMPPNQPPPPQPPIGVPFQIEFPPIPSESSPLEMPTGTAIDLRLSGFGPSGDNFNSASGLPLMLTFSPGGDVERVYANGTYSTQVTRMHFLVASVSRVVDGPTLATGPVSDPLGQWVSVQARSGHVTTADNVPPSDFSSTQAALTQARQMAVSFETKGGR